MNYKKILLLVLTIAIASFNVAPISTIASDPNESSDVYFYDDFYTGYAEDSTGFLNGIKLTGVTGSSNTIKRTMVDGNGMMELIDNSTTGNMGVEFSKELGEISGKPKLILETRVKVHLNHNPSYLAPSTSTVATPSFAFQRTNATGAGGTGFKKQLNTDPPLKAIDATKLYGATTYYTVIVVYENESDLRTIYLVDETDSNNVIVTAYNGVTGSTYSSTGKFTVGFRAVYNSFKSGLQGSQYIDYVKLSKYYDDFGFKVVNSESTKLNEIDVQFDFAVAKAALLPQNYSISGATVKSVTKDPQIPNRYKLQLDSNLDLATTYSIETSNIVDITGRTATGIQNFTTRTPVYNIENLTLSDGTEDLDSLQSGNLKVKFDVNNETSNPLNPVLVAVSYKADGSIGSLNMQEFHVGKENIYPIELSLTIDDAIINNKNLSLYVLESKNQLLPISGAVKYTLTEKTTSSHQSTINAYEETPEFQYTIDSENNGIKITADTLESSLDREINLFVLKKGKKIEDIDLSNPQATIAYTAYQTTNNGKGEFDFTMSEGNAYFPVYLAVSGSSQYYIDGFSFFSKEYIDQALSVVNTATKSDEIKTFLTDYEKACELDLTLLNSLNDIGENHVYSSILALRNELSEKVFESISQFKEYLNIASVLGQITEGENLATILSKNKGLLKLNEDAYSLYNNTLSFPAKNHLAAELSENKYLTVKELSDSFTKNVIFSGIYKAENYKQTRKILTTMFETIGIDLTKYNALSNQEKADNKLTGKLFTSYADLKNAFNNAVSDAGSTTSGSSGSTGSKINGGGTTSTTISVSTEEEAKAETPKAPSFTDFSKSHWAWNAVSNLYSKGVIQGKTSVSFAPDDYVTRAEFIKMVVTAFGITNTASANKFKDINANDWFYSYVITASGKGIINGTDANTFSPNQTITREMAATILYNAGMSKGKAFSTKNTSFKDMSKIENYAYDPVAYLSGIGAISGFETNEFKPEDLCDRAQAAQFIYNLLQLI